MNFHQTVYIFLLAFCWLAATHSQKNSLVDKLDVLSYDLTFQTDMANKSFVGTVGIDFRLDPGLNEVTFNCGDLKIEEVLGKEVKNYEQKGKKLLLFLHERHERANYIQIRYAGRPSHGLQFDFRNEEVYTVFSTSQWMPCNDSPSDRAKFKINLSIPADKQCVASGSLIETSRNGNTIQYSWVQDYESPSYTYGFAIGAFTTFKETYGNLSLNYHSPYYTSEELETIFSPTKEMVAFFEAKSGMPYRQSSYSQVLMGNHYQEMSGFSVLKKSYGKLVLNDGTETNLISHELAHQWWGNMITCENWNHFWLNEGLATFMSAAFNEHKFGKDKYESDISAYRRTYETIKSAGKDKALVFDDWSNPTTEDRNLVYFKGAYVIHLLRGELGERDFWNGLKHYSQKYFNRSVDTVDFQEAFEESANRDLDAFFSKWIY